MRVWPIGRAICVGVAAVLCGCSQYKDIALHEVQSSRADGGREVALVAEDYISFKEIIERSPNVRSVTRMTNYAVIQDEDKRREPSYPTVSSVGDWLVYQALEEEGGKRFMNLWRVSTLGSRGVTRMTRGRYLDMEPTFTPDGRMVCFASNRSSRLSKLWRIRADGAGGLTQVTSGGSDDRYPSVTPDGSRVFYSSKPESADTWQIWSITQGGTLPTQITEGRWPKVSPDGRHVLYCTKDPDIEKWKIWVMSTDGTNPTQITSNENCNDVHPSWSSDGTKIVYASNIGKDSNGKRNHDIWVMSADGSNPTQLTTNGSTDLMPSYSADGRYIYFLSNRGWVWDIWRMEIQAVRHRW